MALVLIGFIGVFDYNQTQAATVSVTTVMVIGHGGSLAWNGETNENCKCTNVGNNCYIEVTKVDTIKTNDNKLYLSTTVLGLNAHITTTNTNFNTPVNNNNYQFPDGSKITITNCDEYPQLNGRVIELTGKQTDANGNITIEL